MLMYAVRARRL